MACEILLPSLTATPYLSKQLNFLDSIQTVSIVERLRLIKAMTAYVLRP